MALCRFLHFYSRVGLYDDESKLNYVCIVILWPHCLNGGGLKFRSTILVNLIVLNAFARLFSFASWQHHLIGGSQSVSQLIAYLGNVYVYVFISS